MAPYRPVKETDPQFKFDIEMVAKQAAAQNARFVSNGTSVPYKYNEPELLKEIAAYIEKTYHGHYVGEDNVQSFDLILASGHATGFNVGNILKYGSRYGKKRGFNRDDLLKVIHYALFELYVHSKNHRGDNASGEQRPD